MNYVLWTPAAMPSLRSRFLLSGLRSRTRASCMLSDASCSEFVRKIIEPINGLKGDDPPVSALRAVRTVRGERYGRLREARHRREHARMEDRELYPGQPVRLCLRPHAVIRPF